MKERALNEGKDGVANLVRIRTDFNTGPLNPLVGNKGSVNSKSPRFYKAPDYGTSQELAECQAKIQEQLSLSLKHAMHSPSMLFLPLLF